MHLRVIVAGLAVLAGCAHSYTTASYDVTRKTSGTMTAMDANPDRKSGTVALGFGGRGASMEIVVHAQDVETSVDSWLAGSAGLELKLTPLRKGPVAAFLHGGPMRAALVDSTTGDITWGAGLDYGLGLSIGGGGVRVLVDVRNEETFWAGSAMEGLSGQTSTRTVSVGLQLGGG